jgi:putative tricarboxylic transport membrane protein
MKERKTKWGLFLIIPGLLFCVSDLALALDPPKAPPGYPARSIEYVVRWGAGGGAGKSAHHVAQTIKKYLDVDMRVIEMPGAGGITAFNAFMEKPADGYSILNTDTHIIIGTLLGKTKYSIYDLMNVCRLQHDISVLCVRAKDERFPNFDAMLKYARQKPGNLVMSVPDAGGMGDVFMRKLGMLGGFSPKQVPYAAFGERVAVVIGGHADVVFEEAADMIPYIKDGAVKPIFVLLKQQMTADPYKNVACSGDYGWDHDLAIWRGIGLKKGTPVERARYIEKVFEFYQNTPEGKAYATENFMDLRRGFIPWEEHDKVIEQEVKIYKETMEKIGMLKAK